MEPFQQCWEGFCFVKFLNYFGDTISSGGYAQNVNLLRFGKREEHEQERKVILGGSYRLAIYLHRVPYYPTTSPNNGHNNWGDSDWCRKRMAKYEQAAQEIKKTINPKTIVEEVFEWLFEKHGDHYHFVYGAPCECYLWTEKPGATTRVQ